MNTYKDIFSLKGRTALVTGSSRGIGARSHKPMQRMARVLSCTDRGPALRPRSKRRYARPAVTRSRSIASFRRPVPAAT